MNNSEIITFEIINNIGVIYLNNVPHNYLEDPEFINLNKIQEWIADNELKGLIFTGKGRHFSAGADKDKLFELASGNENLKDKIAKGSEILKFISDIEIPTFAAIKGACFGAGFEIALACHIRVCSEKSIFAFPEVNLNIMPGLNGTVRLPGLVGIGNAVEILLSGDIINSEKAREMKLVSHIVPSKEVFDFSFSLLNKMVKDRPMKVINYIIRSINNHYKLSFKEAITEEAKMFCELAVDEAKRIEK